MARACATQTKACYLKLAGPSLVRIFIGDGAKLVRDAFELAQEKAQAIIFIDELDAIGTQRFDSEKSGDREVQRTMLELLNQLDGFSSDERIKVRHLTCPARAPVFLLAAYLYYFPNRSSPPPIVSTSSTPRSLDQDVLTGRSNFLCPTKPRAPASWRSTRER